MTSPAPATARQPAAAPALHDIGARIASISLENISTIAEGAFGPGHGIIPLWFGEGDLPTPAFIGEATTAAIRAGHTFYAHQNGIAEFREALSDYYNGLYPVDLGPDRFTATASGMQAIMIAVQLLVDAGDNVIVIDPVWPNLGGMVEVAGGEVRSVRMDLGPAGWSLDIAKVRAACNNRTRAIFFASPGNPTGAMLSIAEQQALLDLSRDTGVWLIADEVYHRLVFGQRTAPSMLTLAEPEDHLLVVNSFSKSYAMTGWRMGWLVHPPSLAATIAMIVQYTSSGTTTFLQHGAAAALRHGEAFIGEMNAYCAAGADIVHDALATMPRVRMGPRPTAAMYVFFEIDGMPDSRAACLDILRRTRVGLAPGIFFGPGSESFLRICFCRAPAALHEAMERLRPALS